MTIDEIIKQFDINSKAIKLLIENTLNDETISLNEKWKFFEYIVKNNLLRNEFEGSELELTSFPSEDYPLYDSFHMERGQSRSMILLLDNIVYINNEDELEIDIDDVKKEIIEKRYTHHINDW